jgi:hypothetical protein
MRRTGRAAALLVAALLLATARCTPAAPAPAPTPVSGADAGALSALVEFLAARADVDSVTVASAPAYSRDRVPVYVWGQIVALPGMDATTLVDFERRNAAAAPLPRLASSSIAIQHDSAAAPGTLRLRLSPAGIGASGAQALVIAETVSAGGVQGEAFLLRREAEGWRVAASTVLFIS